MPRTVVPPPRLRSGAEARRAGVRPVGGDGLPEKLVKFVPAETLAFFVPLAAGIGGDRDVLLIIVLIAGVAGTLGYLYVMARRAEPEERPRVHFYVLACVAFLAWALGTSPNVADLVGLDQLAAGVVLGLAVFLVPMGDDLLNLWT